MIRDIEGIFSSGQNGLFWYFFYSLVRQQMTAPNDDGGLQLGPGVAEESVRQAIAKSGYPLQSVVGDLFRNTRGTYDDSFFVQEEWCYKDDDSKDLRTIDLLASLALYNFEEQLQGKSYPRIRPELTLLVECKQSQLPYVFFEAGDDMSWSGEFPIIAGLHGSEIVATTDDDPSTWTEPVVTAMGLERHAFQSPPHFCHILSKCVRKGNDIELSGSDAYNGLVLPLVKALKHYVTVTKPPKTALYFDCHLAIPIAVIDAPMICAGLANGKMALSMAPWIRVARHEYRDADHYFDREGLYFIDAVHRDFLREYLEKHVIPFAHEFAEAAMRHQTEIAEGLGFVPGLGQDNDSNWEKRLRPRPLVNLSRGASAAKSIGNALRLWMKW